MAEALKQYEDNEEKRVQEMADKADALAKERACKSKNLRLSVELLNTYHSASDNNSPLEQKSQ